MQALITQNPVDHRAEVAQFISLAKGEHDHKPAIEPNPLHNYVVSHQVTYEIFFTFDSSNVVRVLGHAGHKLVNEIFFGAHRGSLDVSVVHLGPIDWQGFQNVFETHTVIGFFPHL